MQLIILIFSAYYITTFSNYFNMITNSIISTKYLMICADEILSNKIRNKKDKLEKLYKLVTTDVYFNLQNHIT